MSRCFLDFSVGVAAFVIGLSQISSLFSLQRLGTNNQPKLRGNKNMVHKHVIVI